MKTNPTLFSCKHFCLLFFCIAACIQKTSAQANIQTNYASPITLDYNNYIVPPLADYFRQGANASGVPVPKQGIHEKWDYSVLVKNDAYNSSQTYEHVNNFMFQNARRQNNFVYVLGGIIALQETGYESDDHNSFSRIGRSLNLQKFPLGMLTGSANDSLIIDQQYDFDEGNFAMVTYPCTTLSSWTNNVRVTTQFHLSVAAFGYDHSPGQFVQRETLARKVVGFGKMRIPSGAGKTPYEDVLMIRSVHTIIDSVYIDGKPAPDALLAAFGLKQGETSSENSYVFLRQGVDEPLITFNMDTSFNAVTSIQYDAKYAEIYCGNKEKICYNGSQKCVPYAMVTPALLQSDLVTIGSCVNRFVIGKSAENITATVLQNLKAFPNPSHDQFTLSLNNDEKKWITVRVMDITGKVLLQLQTTSQQITFGSQLIQGVYFAEIINGGRKQTIKLVKL